MDSGNGFQGGLAAQKVAAHSAATYFGNMLWSASNSAAPSRDAYIAAHASTHSAAQGSGYSARQPPWVHMEQLRVGETEVHRQRGLKAWFGSSRDADAKPYMIVGGEEVYLQLDTWQTCQEHL